VRVLLKHLDEIQGAFISLLSDPKTKHLSRESCCLGLAACRGLLQSETGTNGRSPEELNNRLLRAFGQSTTFAGSAMQESRSQAAQRRSEAGVSVDNAADAELESSMGMESEVGGASGIGEAALGAYREMASASVSLGRHDILYALLILSVSNSYWFTAETRHRYR
jgi:proteasome component ECM29